MTTTSQPAHQHRRRRRPASHRPAALRRGKGKLEPRFVPDKRYSRTRARKPSRPSVSDYEALFFPAWMDDDPAGEGPNYLGYTTTLLPLALLVEFAILALALIW